MNEARDKEEKQEPAKVVPLQKDEFGDLRRLLLSTEQSQIQQIAHRLDDPETRAREMGSVLSEAIVSRTGDDDSMVTALMPTVEEIVATSVKRDPRTLADALFPVMGPAIRRSVAEFFRTMVQSLNNTLEKGLSVSGLKWRIEAWRTGKPFAEIVLLHSLVFRVEQVFLIHRETGLLLAHVSGESVEFQDADIVSGMLTAIQDFVRDSFRPGQGEALENLQVGELTVVVEEGPLAYLCAVIRGSPPQELRTTFKEALEAIHLKLHQAMETFDGNTVVFHAAETYLNDCLLDRYATEQQKSFPYFTVISTVILLAAAWWLFSEFQAQSRLGNYVKRLGGEKGIVVVSAERRGESYSVTGLRDPLAADPGALVDGSGIEARQVKQSWEPFQAMDPEFVLTRAKASLCPPASAILTIRDGVLTATGTAPYEWIEDSRRIARLIPGVREYRDRELVPTYDVMIEAIRKTLVAPPTVTLSFESRVLSSKGTATYQWVQDARRLARLIPGIEDYNDRELAVTYDLVLERIIRSLAPPPTVSLSMTDGVLTARGTAGPQWIKDARRVAGMFPEVREYRDKELAIDYTEVLERVKRVLSPPEGVSLKISNGVAIASGQAPHQWIVDARKTVRVVDDVAGYEDRLVRDQDYERLVAVKAHIEASTLLFERNETRVLAGQQEVISNLANQIKSLLRLGRILDLDCSVYIRGHTDSSGAEARNLAVSQKRAETVATVLTGEGIPSGSLLITGLGASQPVSGEASENERMLNRRVGFSVVIDEGPGRGGQR